MPIRSGRSVMPAFMPVESSGARSSRLGEEAEGVGDLRRADHAEGLRVGQTGLVAGEAIARGAARDEVGVGERRLLLMTLRTRWIMEVRAVAADRRHLL